MDEKQKKAIISFRSGYNCAQSVLTAFSNELNLDSNTAQSISSGFGGGMGKLQETCGAVTGSFMVFGLYIGSKFPDNKEKKEKTNELIQRFNQKFSSLHQSTNCKTLLNADINTQEGQLFLKQNNSFEKVCEKCISDAITIVRELIK